MNVGECRLFRGARSRLSRIIEMRSTALLVGYWITVADGVEGGVPEVKERLSASDRIDAVKDEAGKLSLLSWRCRDSELAGGWSFFRMLGRKSMTDCLGRKVRVGPFTGQQLSGPSAAGAGAGAGAGVGVGAEV
jgi:hypothetical protein